MTPEDIARSISDWERMLPVYWRGIPCQQFATDMLRYAELLAELNPPFVVECGTGDGGCALFLADMLPNVYARAVSIDNDPRRAAATHPQLLLWKGGAASPRMAARVADRAGPGRRGLVLLDSDHTAAQVLAELDLWAPLADYLVVEDTLMGYLPQYPDNPLLAVEKWLPDHPEFTADAEPVPTNHPGGWLRRVAG